MTGSTHVAIGIASSVAMMQPKTIPECLCAVAGGMVGGMICDIDNHGARSSWDYREDPYGWQVYAFVVIGVAIVLGLDYLSGHGAVDYLINNSGPPMWAGGGAFVVLCIIGAITKHRTFMHSFLAGALLTAAVWFFCQPLAVPFAIGFASHIILDFFNETGVTYFWPIQTPICLNKFPYDGKLNNALGGIGTLASIYLVVYFFITSFASSELFTRIIGFFSMQVSIKGLITVPMIVPYLVILNIVTFIIYIVDCFLYTERVGLYSGTEERRDNMAEFLLTLLLGLGIAGGMIGMLLAVLIILGVSFSKGNDDANFNFYIIPLNLLVIWAVLIFTFVLPSILPWVGALSSMSIASIPLRYIVLGYFVVISIITFFAFQWAGQFTWKITSRELLCLFLSFIGGATGGYLEMKTTGKHENAVMMKGTLPGMIIMHAIVLVCVFFPV